MLRRPGESLRRSFCLMPNICLLVLRSMWLMISAPILGLQLLPSLTSIALSQRRSEDVKWLSKITEAQPHAAYDRLSCQWLFICHTVPGISSFLQLLDNVICQFHYNWSLWFIAQAFLTSCSLEWSWLICSLQHQVCFFSQYLWAPLQFCFWLLPPLCWYFLYSSAQEIFDWKTEEYSSLSSSLHENFD